MALRERASKKKAAMAKKTAAKKKTKKPERVSANEAPILVAMFSLQEMDGSDPTVLRNSCQYHYNSRFVLETSLPENEPVEPCMSTDG